MTELVAALVGALVGGAASLGATLWALRHQAKVSRNEKLETLLGELHADAARMSANLHSWPMVSDPDAIWRMNLAVQQVVFRSMKDWPVLCRAVKKGWDAVQGGLEQHDSGLGQLTPEGRARAMAGADALLVIPTLWVSNPKKFERTNRDRDPLDVDGEMPGWLR
ncbi:hypothetical protein [Terrabacter sp. MAHUQ-38]|uniref:hypothetical protein n=1 Tax=unclassified Terrabacter TaxID=2630222 RepID=UPI00165E008F|nr:hypothetical protein [Terrabacter sp. MAHUQ-38]MBC9820118.1 hypothetical protein [Terrabacter sp. MAHUQ-38]